MPRRDGPENLRILKRQVVEFSAVEFFGSLPAEILNTTISAARGGGSGGVSIVWLI